MKCRGTPGGCPVDAASQCHPEPQRRVCRAGSRDASLRLSMTGLRRPAHEQFIDYLSHRLNADRPQIRTQVQRSAGTYANTILAEKVTHRTQIGFRIQNESSIGR
jgi:hypothetical protein